MHIHTSHGAKKYLGLQQEHFSLQNKGQKAKKIQTDLPKKVYGPTLIKVQPNNRAGLHLRSVSHKMDPYAYGKSPHT